MFKKPLTDRYWPPKCVHRGHILHLDSGMNWWCWRIILRTILLLEWSNSSPGLDYCIEICWIWLCWTGSHHIDFWVNQIQYISGRHQHFLNILWENFPECPHVIESRNMKKYFMTDPGNREKYIQFTAACLWQSAWCHQPINS